MGISAATGVGVATAERLEPGRCHDPAFPRIFALARLTTCGSDGWGDHFDGNVIARAATISSRDFWKPTHESIPVEKNPDNHFGKE